MLRRTLSTFVAVVVIVSVLLSLTAPAVSAAAPTPPPSVGGLTAAIEVGQALNNFPPDGAFRVTFNLPVAANTIEQPVLVYPYLTGKVTWEKNRTLLVFQPDQPLTPGQNYSIYLDPKLKADSGAGFASPPAWDIRVQDAPVITTVSFPSGEEIQQGGKIKIYFDRAMDQASLFDSVRIDPPLDFTPSYIAKTLTIDLKGPLPSGSTYRLFLASGARSEQGTPLGSETSWPLIVPKLAIELDQISAEGFWVRSNYALMNYGSEFPAKVDPNVSGAWKRISEKVYQFIPARPLNALDTFTLRVTGSLKSDKGTQFTAPEPLKFTLPAPINYYEPGPQIQEASSIVVINFTRGMDHPSTEAAFSLSPAVNGKFQWNGNTLNFIPDTRLQANTLYIVTLKPSALDAQGLPVMAEPFTWSFNLITVYDYNQQRQVEVSFGYWGVNAQVVYSKGRRAVQYGNGAYNQETMPATLTMDLYSLEASDFAQRYKISGRSSYGAGPKIDTTGLTSIKKWYVQTDANHEIIIPHDVPNGLYILNMATEKGLQDQLFLSLGSAVLVLKHSGQEVFAWVTDLTGKALQDWEVRIYNQKAEKISQGRSGENGLYRAILPPGDEPLLVIARGDGDITVSGFTGWSRSVSGKSYWGWTNDEPGRYVVYTYTDRPIYRPGQTIHFKSIVRRDRDARYTMPPQDSPVKANLLDEQNRVLQTLELRTNSFGSVSGEFVLLETTGLGDYQIETVYDNETHKQAVKVQEYRKPDIQLSLQPEQEIVVAGTKAVMNIHAGYFFGKPLANSKLDVTLYQLSPYYYGWWDDTAAEDGQDYLWTPYSDTSVTTDAEGNARLELPASMGDDQMTIKSWRDSLNQAVFAVEINADDGSGQVVSSSTMYRVYNSDIKLSVNAPSYQGSVGQPFTVNVEGVTIEGKPAANQAVSIEVRRWDNNSYTYRYLDQQYDLALDAKGKGTTQVSIDKPGYVQLHLKAVDSRGQTLEDNDYIWLSGTGEAVDLPWNPSEAVRIEVEKDTPYRPYEKARFFIHSSFSGPALLTFERQHTLRAIPVTLTPPLTTVEAQISEDDYPNVFVAINAWQYQDTAPKEVQQDTYYSLTRPDGKLRAAQVEIKVEDSSRLLQLKLSAGKQTYAPREDATFEVQVNDAAGKPVQAEVSLALVDESIFALSNDLSRTIQDHFYGRRDQTVNTYDSMVPVRELMVGGRGGGGGDSMGNGSPRSNFPDTAVWLPAVQTDQNGRASITVQLPDTLTSWRLTARAVTRQTQVAQAVLNVLTQKEVVIRPVIPPGMTASDQMQLSALVHNYSQKTQQLEVRLSAAGLRLSGEARQKVTLQPEEVRLVQWPVSAEKIGSTQVTVEAAGENGTLDSVRLPLEIRPHAVKDIQAQSGVLKGDISIPFALPPDTAENSTIEVRISRSVADSLWDGLETLIGYPYGCVEQTMSKALPNAVVGRALKKAGRSNPTLENRLPELIDSGLLKLYGMQHDDGGWGWWFDDTSDVYQTAWVVFGLATTAEAGTNVDGTVIDNGLRYLKDQLAKTGDEELDSRIEAFVLYSMAAAGKPDEARSLALAGQAATLDPFSQAALALALHSAGKDQAANQVLDLLLSAAVLNGDQAHWNTQVEDGEYHRKTMASTVRSTALALKALIYLRPGDERIPAVARWLMANRQGYSWGTTNETSFAVLALSDYIVFESEQPGEAGYRLALNGANLSETTLSPGDLSARESIAYAQIGSGVNLLTLTQTGDLPLYYAVTFNTFLNRDQINTSGNILVERRFLPIRGDTPLDSFQPGQLVKVELTVSVDYPVSFLVLEDHLPAGFEALNERLNTTTRSALSEYTYYYEDYYRWNDYGYNQKEIHDDRVAFFFTRIEKSVTITYLARAVHSGSFFALPAEASAMYDLRQWGRSASQQVEVSQ